MRFKDYGNLHQSVTARIAKYQEGGHELYEERDKLERQMKRQYRLCAVTGPAWAGRGGDITVEISPSGDSKYGMRILISQQHLDYLPAVGFRRLARLRELIDDFVAGKIDQLPDQPPWEVE